jgi:predicted Zn-dependent protease
MFVLKCTKPAFFDIDGTLIEWRPSEDSKEVMGTECKWPIRSLGMGEDGKIFIKEQFEEDSFIRLDGNIEQLKEHKRRGHTVIVWSAGGWRWAETAVRMLGLEDYVDIAMEKPASIYDDRPLEEFMPKVQFIGEDEPKKEDSKKPMSKGARADDLYSATADLAEALAVPRRR